MSDAQICALVERLRDARPTFGTGYDAGYVAACAEILREIQDRRTERHDG
jgi:hypothetical protein